MIPEQVPVKNHYGNNVATTFTFDFYIESEEQLKVVHTDYDGTQTTLTVDVDYTIHEIGNESGSYITFPIQGSSYGVLGWNQTTGKKQALSISLDLPISQESEYDTSSLLDLDSLEYSLDYLTRIAQIQNRLMERAVKVQEGSDIDSDQLTVNLNKVAENVSSVTTAATNITNIVTTSNNIDDVNTVAEHISNVNAVGLDIENIDAVKNDLANIDTVESNLANVNSVAGSITNVNAVAEDLTNINIVKDSLNNINTVSTNINDVNTVAENVANVNSVAGSITNVNAVANDLTNIDAVNNDLTNVNIVANDIGNVDIVANNNAKISSVADNETNINTAATNIDAIKDCSENIEDVKNASANAQTSIKYAIGYPEEPAEGSSKYWAGQAAQGQIQPDWNQTDTTQKDYIKNKPTKLSDFEDDSETNPIDKADTLTGLTSSIDELNILDGVTANANEINVLDGIETSTTELNYVKGATSNIQTEINYLWNDNDRLYQGVDLSVKFADEIAGYSTIYDWLNARKNAGNFDGIHVGDYMNVPTSAGTCAGYSIPAQTHKCRIIGINTYKHCADTDIGDMIYFSSDNVIDTTIKWNPTDNNNGTSVNNEPYLASAAYAILNGVNNYTTSAYGSAAHGANSSSCGILQLLPSALQNVLKQKRNLLDTRYSSSGLLTNSASWGWKDMGKLWLPNEIEVYGTQIRSNTSQTSGWWNPEANLSIQFPWFANNCNNRIKFNSSGGRCNWWLSSAVSDNSTNVCSVSGYGDAGSGAATGSSRCLPVCFCI